MILNFIPQFLTLCLYQKQSSYLFTIYFKTVLNFTRFLTHIDYNFHVFLQMMSENSHEVIHRKHSVSSRERPKSDINVHWPQHVKQVASYFDPRHLPEHRESTISRPRPKSDLGNLSISLLYFLKIILLLGCLQLKMLVLCFI